MNNDLNQNNTQSSQNANQPMENVGGSNQSSPSMNNQPINNQPKKDNKLGIILLIVLVVILIGVVIYFISNKDKNKDIPESNKNNVEVDNPVNNPEHSEQPQNEDKPQEQPQNENKPQEENIVPNGNEITNYFEVEIDGHKIGLPATKEDFDKIGWEWDPKRAEEHIDSGYTTSGGRIGKYPGGVVVNVVNNSGELKKISECQIDMMTFYNPKDGSENIKFIGGLNFNSTLDQIKSTMDRLGFKNPKVYDKDKLVNYKYYENNDSKNMYHSYIEFEFYNNEFKEVTLKKRIR